MPGMFHVEPLSFTHPTPAKSLLIISEQES